MKNLLFCILVATFSSYGVFSHDRLDYLPTHNNFAYNHSLPNNTYHKYCKIIYSQNGEDGIIEQLLKELGIKSGYFCEFGAMDGITGSNTYNLMKNHHFSGMAIECNANYYKSCAENYRSFPNVQVFQGFVLYNDKNFDLNAWLKRGKAPHDLDVLSIDIDGDDYYVWENLTDFKPKIVIFEINTYRDPVYDELPGSPSNEYNIDLLKQWFPSRVGSGCSFISAVKLGLKKGYIPVGYAGTLIFLRKDLVHHLKEFPYILSEDPYDYITLYDSLSLGKQWNTNTGLILNTAIRDYYLEFKKKFIDVDWINKRMKQIIENGEYRGTQIKLMTYRER